MRTRFFVAIGRRFGSGAVVGMDRGSFPHAGTGSARNAGRVAWPRTRVAGRLELRLSRRHSTRVRWLLAHEDLLPVDTWGAVAFSLLLAEK